jgi:predicted nucleotidyltransferase
MDKLSICKELHTWATSQPVIYRVWLFGSHARGEAGPDSDIDIAVEVVPVHADESVTDCWFTHSSKWRSELAARFPFRIQLELLDGLSTPTISRGIARSGVLVYERAT